MTQTKTVTPVHVSPVPPTEDNTKIFFKLKYGHESQLGARGQDGLTD